MEKEANDVGMAIDRSAWVRDGNRGDAAAPTPSGEEAADDGDTTPRIKAEELDELSEWLLFMAFALAAWFVVFFLLPAWTG